ncbi:MAG: hypothetical protein QGH51_01340 [Planctomycetota bacterium]|jgi:phosphotransferase system  glucose/maltose/N-acetylglucosamine-specific IIC component|nr:hypothetical protein [Planctomycetota bacterium]MDP6940646.1 hypothetical protein [Planctomycetota bacterium]
MKLDVRAMALTIGILWGLHFLLFGIFMMFCPSFGGSWIQLWADIYPLYEGSGGVLDTLIGTVFGVVDGIIAGAVIAWLYNRIARNPS